MTTITAAQLAERAGIPVAELQQEIADAGALPKRQPNRAERRMLAKRRGRR